jgi:cystathionine beta-lyase
MNPTELLQSIPVCPLTGALSVPIYQTSTFVQQAPGVNKGFDYSRTNNPTRQALETIMAEFECGVSASAFASGLAAIDAVIRLLEKGDEIIAVDDIYGGAFRQFTHIHEKMGIHVTYVNTADPDTILQNMGPNTKMIWLESPTNPTLKISDIRAIAEIAKDTGCLLVVDNTFASPVLQQPITLGADIVVHSATKYLGGHSDLIAGIVITRTKELGEKIKFVQNAVGAVLGPFDSWLVIRGLETIHLRMRQHNSSAIRVAKYLQNHYLVKQVYYPGLPNHPGHVTARYQSSGFGGIVSFSLHEDTEAAAKKLITATRIFKLAESLGGAKSLICHPATMTHKSIPLERRLEAGISPSLIRLSIGLEQAIDLINDLQDAIKATNRTTIKEVSKKERTVLNDDIISSESPISNGQTVNIIPQTTPEIIITNDHSIVNEEVLNQLSITPDNLNSDHPDTNSIETIHLETNHLESKHPDAMTNPTPENQSIGNDQDPSLITDCSSLIPAPSSLLPASLSLITHHSSLIKSSVQ